MNKQRMVLKQESSSRLNMYALEQRIFIFILDLIISWTSRVRHFEVWVLIWWLCLMVILLWHSEDFIEDNSWRWILGLYSCSAKWKWPLSSLSMHKVCIGWTQAGFAGLVTSYISSSCIWAYFWFRYVQLIKCLWSLSQIWFLKCKELIFGKFVDGSKDPGYISPARAQQSKDSDVSGLLIIGLLCICRVNVVLHLHQIMSSSLQPLNAHILKKKSGSIWVC